jgi:hypothetical protein
VSALFCALHDAGCSACEGTSVVGFVQTTCTAQRDQAWWWVVQSQVLCWSASGCYMVLHWSAVLTGWAAAVDRQLGAGGVCLQLGFPHALGQTT